MSAADPPGLVGALLAWYDRHRRELPWRGTRDPYRVWVSEVMLQQTRVEAVIPHFHRFLARFPDLATLAAAEEAEVLAAWSGLGYYRRARLLLRGARHVATELGGELPRDRAGMLAIPGIGPYTAGAILSIAFDLPEPVVDGNVERVLTRHGALPGDPRRAPLKAELWQRAAGLASGPRPGDRNQALMELGATVCTPRSPRCGECPLAASCAGRAGGAPESFPQLAARPKPVEVELACMVVEAEPGLLFFRRPDHGSLAGMWELPTVEATDPDEDLPARLEAEILARTGARVRAMVEVGKVRHTIMSRRITLTAWQARFRRDPRRPDPKSWDLVPIPDLAHRAMSSMYRKVLALRGVPGEAGPGGARARTGRVSARRAPRSTGG